MSNQKGENDDFDMYIEEILLRNHVGYVEDYPSGSEQGLKTKILFRKDEICIQIFKKSENKCPKTTVLNNDF